MKKKHTLLMVDQDAYYAGIYANRFEQAGWKVRVAEGIEAAKTQLEKEVPDVMVVDLDPPDETMIFLKEFRSRTDADGTLLVVLSELGDRSLLKEAEEIGVDTYLLKGHFVPAEAVKKVTRLLEEKNV
jgi:DNA-binding response OmpR family regulator